MQLTIGRLAAATDVNVETIRYYHRRGILEEPARHTGGHRRYQAEHLKRVRFIKRAQALGFTLNEIADLLDLADDCSCASMRNRAVQKRMLIDGKIAALTAIRQAIDTLVRQCDASGGDADCPILDALQREEYADPPGCQQQHQHQHPANRGGACGQFSGLVAVLRRPRY